MEEKVPEFDTGKPVWWHHHGSKMHLVAQGIFNDFVVLQGSAAEVIIKKAKDQWQIDWRINHGAEGLVCGRAFFPTDILLAAFGLLPIVTQYGAWLINRFGGTAAEQFKFIRYQNWLNIPCPGTGHDGDPNISIELDEEIKKAVHDLIFECRLD